MYCHTLRKTQSARRACLLALVLSALPLLAQDAQGPRNWSWGDADERGAGNLITPESILEALSAVERGEVIELSHEVVEGAPHIPGLQPAYKLGMHLTSDATVEKFAEEMSATNGIGVNLERIEMTTHVSTHIDAIGHISVGDTLYSGASGKETVAVNGLAHGGIEKAPPFIARAVLIDVARYKGVDRLEAGYAITPEDLEGALKAQGSQITRGVIALLHTGSDESFLADPHAHAESTPGISLDAARWLSSRRVIAVGGDNHGVEVLPGETPGELFPVHQHLITNQGIYMIENMKLDELAARKAYESTVIILPTKFKGATAAPVRIIALL